MSYKLLLKVLPYDFVALIYEFMKVNAANVIYAYFANAKRRYNVFVALSHYSIEYISEHSIYSIKYSMQFDSYAEVPQAVSKEIIAKVRGE